MKSEWHRYNLKRRVAQLPPIDEETFNQKVTLVEEPKEPVKLSKRDQRKQELLEKKRQLLELAKSRMQEGPDAEVPAEIEVEEKSQEQIEEELINEKLANKVEIPLDHCLFCHKALQNLDTCCEHMAKFHGLYIPEQRYLVDKAGLIGYLSEKIGFGNVCLVCNYQGRNLEAVRAHMNSKRHCRIPYETENEKLEISDFYDFSSTYNDVNRNPVIVTEGDDDWEDVEGEEEEGEGDQEEAELPQNVAYSNGYELYMPSGSIVGHRSLHRYYKQNLKPEKELSEGQGTLVTADTRHFAGLQSREEVNTTKRIWKKQARSLDQYEKKSKRGINFQKHYRDPLLQ